MRDYWQRVRERLPIVRQLYALGMTKDRIAESLGFHPATIVNDLRRLGGPRAFSGRPRGRLSFPGLFRRHCILSVGTPRGGAADRQSRRIAAAIARHLKLDEMEAYCRGVAETMESLMSLGHERPGDPYLLLLDGMHRLAGMRRKLPRRVGLSYRRALVAYMRAVASGSVRAPVSPQEVEQKLRRLIVSHFRPHIAPTVPAGATALVAEAHRALPPIVRRAVELRYGIGCRPRTLVRVGRALGRTPERARQLESIALRRLERRIGPLLNPLATSLEEYLRLLERERAGEKLVRGGGAARKPRRLAARAIPALLKSVDELDLSVRSARCMRIARIRLIGELVQQRPEDLLQYRNFGSESLRNIEDRLGAAGLSLGITLGPQVKAALREAREATSGRAATSPAAIRR